jgi:hypothetical protein
VCDPMSPFIQLHHYTAVNTIQAAQFTKVSQPIGQVEV